ncbi:hypothetical protein ACMFMG_010271 [Clarireedia jacksonii]
MGPTLSAITLSSIQYLFLPEITYEVNDILLEIAGDINALLELQGNITYPPLNHMDQELKQWKVVDEKKMKGMEIKKEVLKTHKKEQKLWNELKILAEGKFEKSGSQALPEALSQGEREE